MIEDIIRETVTKYSYHLSDECVNALVDKLEDFVYDAEMDAYNDGWAAADR